MSQHLPEDRDPHDIAPYREPTTEPSVHFPGDAPPRAGGPPWQRYLAAVRRFRWLVVSAAVVGLAGATAAFQVIEPYYMAQGSLWVSNNARRSDRQGPIQEAELLSSYAWVDLLESFAVLDPVVETMKLYLLHQEVPDELFATFELAESFRPGAYTVSADASGATLSLRSDAGLLLAQAPRGEPLGSELGFMWTPAGLAPGEEVPFRVLRPRDAARNLRAQLDTRMDRLGTFITIQLRGRDPERIAATVSALMDRYVEVATRLKRSQLDERTRIVERQLRAVENDLREAERQLQAFRVATITLPSDQAAPIAAGLEQTQDPVLGNYFAMRLSLEQLRRDIDRVAAALEPAEDGSARIQSMELIPAIRNSREMSGILAEIATVRANLRTLREDYTDEYEPVKDAIARLATLEREALPAIGRGLLQDLRDQERSLAELVDSRADELAEIPPRSIEEARLERRRQIANDLYVELRQRYETASLAAASSMADVSILDEPAVPSVPISDERLRWAVMILGGALALALGGAILADRFDPRLRYATEMIDELGLELLGVVPRIARGRKDNSTTVREAFRELRMRVEFAYGRSTPIVLAVTSPASAEGKTFVSANLALAFAGIGRRTLVVDADTRRGDLHTLLGCERKPGLTEFLRTGDDHRLVQRTPHQGLAFIGAGSRSTDSPELLNSRRMPSLLAAVKRHYDIVIFDCPPLGAGGDAFVLGTHAGSVLFVLRSGSTNRGFAQSKLDAFLRLPVRLLGGVLNGADPRAGYGAYRHYGDYLPGYEAVPEEEGDPAIEERTLALKGGD